MTESIAQAIVEGLTNNEEFTRQCLPFLKEEYFGNQSERTLFNISVEYFNKFDRCPSPEVLAISVNEMDLNERVHEECIEVIGRFDDQPKQVEWLLEATEKFCKDRSVYLAIMQSIEIIEGKAKNLNRDAIPTILADALGVSFDTNVGHDYFDDAAARYDLYTQQDSGVPFDLEILNKITGGVGLRNKTLSCVMAHSGGGKSLFMTHVAASALSQGKNVLYITLEMSAAKISERIDANLMDVPINILKTMSKESFMRAVDKIKQKTTGKLVTKEYPTSNAHTGHFKALLEELKTKKKFIPDLIVVDYLNICASQRYKPGATNNSYTIVKGIAEELRALAVQHDVPILTGTQANRSGTNNSDIETTDTSESMGTVHSLDLYLALIPTEELDEMGQIMVKVLKNRYGDLNYYKRFVLGIDRSKMKLFDLESEAQDDIAHEIKPKQDTKAKFNGLKF